MVPGRLRALGDCAAGRPDRHDGPPGRAGPLDRPVRGLGDRRAAERLAVPGGGARAGRALAGARVARAFERWYGVGLVVLGLAYGGVGLWLQPLGAGRETSPGPADSRSAARSAPTPCRSWWSATRSARSASRERRTRRQSWRRWPSGWRRPGCTPRRRPSSRRAGLRLGDGRAGRVAYVVVCGFAAVAPFRSTADQQVWTLAWWGSAASSPR